MSPLLFSITCIVVGIPIGLLLKSSGEEKVSGYSGPRSLSSASPFIKITVKIALNLILGLLMFFVPLYGLVQIKQFMVWPQIHLPVQLLYMIGILIGKALRYAIWLRKGMR
jgi:hypothetical protein